MAALATLTRLAACLGLATLAASAAAAGNLNVYNWNDYIADDTVPNFEKQFDVKVRYDLYDSNEVLQAKLMTGKSGYDVVVPSLEFAARQIKAGIYLKLDKSKLPNYTNLDKAILEKVKVGDPTNDYLVPYMWGTTAFGINVDKVKKALGSEPMPADAWELLFNPKYTNKLKSCGISLFDTGSDVYSLVNIYQGRPANDFSKAALEASNEVLRKVRPDIRVFNSSPIDLLANGDICVGMAYNGDAYIAKDRAEQAKNGQKIEYIVPAKGTIAWIDSMAIPRDAANVDNAYKYINNILDPKVAASISNKVNYANPNSAATPFVNAKLTGDPKIYLTPKMMALTQAKQPIQSDTQRLIASYFNAFKTNK
ncbi:extracellular solute-binding protein [Chitinimonas sp.]|uniref:extracellular solute-binding protein n=1 Tax=Chitinimonas sp. TaxID=1934313 RepID=UPI0035B2C941